MENTGEMTQGKMTGAGAAAMRQMPTSEMPRGEMTGAGAAAMGQMPRVEIAKSEGDEHIGTVELPGLWRLSLSLISR